MLPNQIILLGGGASVRYLGAIDRGLFSFLQDKFVIGINYSYKFCPSTCSLGVDETLYNNEAIHAEIAQLPLWIGKENRSLGRREPNSVFLKESNDYDRDLIKGVYKSSLSGLFALSLAIKLLYLAERPSILSRQGIEIYLLGFDYGPAMKDGEIQYDNLGKALTHWYQGQFQHRGTGKINWYCQTTLDYETKKRREYADVEFAPFKNENNVKIYNVGGTSNIPHFEQISYERFFTHSFISVHNQKELITELKEVLCQIKSTQSN